MKKIFAMLLCLVIMAAFAVWAANVYDKGLSDAGAPCGYVARGALVAATNATEAVTVKQIVQLDGKPYTNTLYTLTCANHFAETNAVRHVAPNALILVTGDGRVFLYD